MSDVYLIDTNIAIHARDGNTKIIAELIRHRGSVWLSALSLAELQRGLVNIESAVSLRRARLDILLEHLPVLAFGKAAAKAYGEIVAVLGWTRGRDFDRMIAGHALSLGATLVTNNERDFRDIPGLRVENWLDAA